VPVPEEQWADLLNEAQAEMELLKDDNLQAHAEIEHLKDDALKSQAAMDALMDDNLKVHAEMEHSKDDAQKSLKAFIQSLKVYACKTVSYIHFVNASF
jgi:hypothetical protein